MPRWAWFLIAVVIGLAAGLLYGWVVDPVEYVDTAPESLRADYRAEYVLMVAEVYHSDRNLDQAARRLALLGSETPARIATQAVAYAIQSQYAESDLLLLQELASDLQTWQPPPAGGAP